MTEEGSMARAIRLMDEKQAAFVPRYRAGGDRLDHGADRRTYSIDVSYFSRTAAVPGTNPIEYGAEQWHGAQIDVHGDRALRDKIVALLTATPEPQ